jgi:hypothetical protein
MWMKEAVMKDKLKNAVQCSFNRLLREDGDLFDCPIEEDAPYDARKLHEVCVNHRLANHLQDKLLPLFGSRDLFVDIEFNREGGNYKKVQVDRTDKVLRPDIIIHNRRAGLEKRNFLVVECKKEGANEEEIDKDKQKILAFMKDERYEYSFGLQVIYGRGRVKGILFSKDRAGFHEEKIGYS